MAKHLQAEICQMAVLVNQFHQALILRTTHGKWQLAGGRLHQDEKWDEGLRREILEETGINDVEILSIMMVDNWEYQGIMMYGTYFLCRTNSNDIRLSNEHTDFRWVGKDDDLSQFDFRHENLRILTERALQMK